ncbi:MAG: FtsQ-type POTRA domain-containing protein [candidate division KSB1 bacterium]|nr:FtsQ-type POTRA domain-containing protein [candidate division KSB1 bacterium]MDZ7319413.1 FtsQ-type POTRA domain-containing protein [candidate division KSB1 bacterium]MDZ7342826.1 FtsQ-type POTRA domain-containing protein [candidate division KSB1 bacterium]
MDRIIKIAVPALIAVVLLVPVVLWYRSNDAFLIRAVTVTGNQFVSREQILDAADIDLSKDIFAIDTDEVEVRILTHPMIDQVSVRRLLPATLKIKVHERTLLAALAGSELAAVDYDGTIVQNYPAAAIYDLPVITGFHLVDQIHGVKKPAQPELLEDAFRILRQLKESDIVLYHEISELHFSPDVGMILYFKKSNLPVVLGRDDLLLKIAYFSTIYHHLTTTGNLNNALAIDIRFKNQVIVKHKS